MADAPKNRKPDNTRFKQQTLPAWTPTLTPNSVVGCFGGCVVGRDSSRVFSRAGSEACRATENAVDPLGPVPPDPPLSPAPRVPHSTHAPSDGKTDLPHAASAQNLPVGRPRRLPPILPRPARHSIGVPFIAIGVCLLAATNAVVEHELRYDQKSECKISSQDAGVDCTVRAPTRTRVCGARFRRSSNGGRALIVLGGRDRSSRGAGAGGRSSRPRLAVVRPPPRESAPRAAAARVRI